ncbi:MAG: AAA family ATPase [Candidatus Parabeggiatoa sp.]|nr:AAA family ATPase [Candidatus Parabeggiatoa sp.]
MSITQIEAKNFRCLHDVRQSLGAFHILVGPNGSGKTTFFDVLALLGRLVSSGLESALAERTHNLSDLFWRKSGTQFELAIEALIPETQRQSLAQPFDKIRYEVTIGTDSVSAETSILSESVFLIGPHLRHLVVSKAKQDQFHPEVSSKFNPHTTLSFKFGSQRSALGNLPEDDSQFPVSVWFKHLLTTGIQAFILNSQLMRQPSPPGQQRGFKPDGSNLPWIIDRLQAFENYQDWISHLQTAIEDIEDIYTIVRPEDRHRYLVIRYRGGLEVPSWMTSDGTLRLLALTLPAYLPDLSGIYLVEEPENGIHPRAVETLYQSLSSVYDAQVLLATHSPIILSAAKVEEILCFAKTKEGATNIVSGNQHPNLAHWKGETNLGVLFAGGVLG